MTMIIDAGVHSVEVLSGDLALWIGVHGLSVGELPHQIIELSGNL